MKKLKLNSTLNHKQDSYEPCEAEVRKSHHAVWKLVREDEELPFSSKSVYHGEQRTDVYRQQWHTHCVMSIIESNSMTEAERSIRKVINEITDKIAEMAHCGDKHFSFEDILSEETLDEIRSSVIQAVGEKLRQREDIRSVQINDLDSL